MKLNRQLYLFVFLLSSSSLWWAQNTPAAKTVVVRAGRLLDVKTGKTLSNQTIVIQGDKIVRVAETTAGELLPAGATAIDLPNATVLPGLIDAHTHLTMNPTFGYSMLGISVPRQALIGAHNARVTLEAGFTTVRNVGAFHYADVACAMPSTRAMCRARACWLQSTPSGPPVVTAMIRPDFARESLATKPDHSKA